VVGVVWRAEERGAVVRRFVETVRPR
jgi:hypothetical protein